MDNNILNQAIKMIDDGEISCAVINNNKIVYTEYGRGVAPLLNILANKPEILKDACVADKIIGKAAAMILVSGGVSHVYGLIMSEAGRDYLEKHGVRFDYAECVNIIKNNDGSGMCPIEQSVLDISDCTDGVKIIRETLAVLRKSN